MVYCSLMQVGEIVAGNHDLGRNMKQSKQHNNKQNVDIKQRILDLYYGRVIYVLWWVLVIWVIHRYNIVDRSVSAPLQSESRYVSSFCYQHFFFLSWYHLYISCIWRPVISSYHYDQRSHIVRANNILGVTTLVNSSFIERDIFARFSNFIHS